ncbi:MAG: serine--tRNA ligase [Dehalococcoidia bacterium]|nr:serine--tRNA ligase [Dehalococcoidia bacterium]
MLSIQFIRENTERVKRDVVLRNSSAPIDRIIQLDDERRLLLGQVEQLRAKRNTVSKAIGASKDPQEREVRITEMRLVGDEIDRLDGRLKAVQSELNDKLLEVPNIVDPSVPKGPDDSSNVVVHTVGQPRTFDFEPKPHWELGEALGGIDLPRGAKMSGSRFYVLEGGISRLYRSLIQWCLDQHAEAGFTECYLPYMLSEASLYASGQLPKFRDNLYRDAEEDYYFIPTAEVAFVNLYKDEIMPPGSLPQRLVAHTPCFRREKMSAGRDVRGMKRGHQFEKVEMFVYCAPEESEAMLDFMVKHARTLPEKLGIPHRVLQLCTGDLGFNSTKTFDIEMWSPGVNEWLEVSSISNCLDFQARRANIRYREKADGPPRYPHMLNGSGLGMVRALIAVIENYQEADGTITVPEVLRPYMRTDRITPRA